MMSPPPSLPLGPKIGMAGREAGKTWTWTTQFSLFLGFEEDEIKQGKKRKVHGRVSEHDCHVA